VAEKRDKRRHPRRATVKFGTDEPVRTGFTEDLSFEGMFIKSTAVLPPKTRLNIEISVPDKGVIRMEGIVMWAKKVPTNLFHLVKKGGMGVKIEKFLSGEDLYVDLFVKKTLSE